MITACVPEPLDVFYGSVIEKGWRDDLHKQFDDWLDTLEEDMRGKEGSLAEIARAIFEMRQGLAGMIAQSLIEKLHSQELEQTEMRCPRCGRY